MKNLMVLDTETINIDKPFVYDIGYIVYNPQTSRVMVKRNYLVKEIWNNKVLFATSYFADKRPLYEKLIKQGKIKVKPFNWIMRRMAKDMRKCDIGFMYAYNAPFDTKVFNFNTNWFKIENPLERVKILDIVPYVHKVIGFTEIYKEFCERHQLFTESGNYSANAENVTRFLTCDTDFKEDHTALADCEIELKILLHCIDKGCEYHQEYKKYACIPRKTKRQFVVRQTINGEIVKHTFDYNKKKLILEEDFLMLEMK